MHAAAREVLKRETAVVSPLVLPEFDHLMGQRIGFDASTTAVKFVLDQFSAGRHRLASITVDDLLRAHEVRMKYADLCLDIADTVGVVLADRYKTDRVFTLDQRDFRAIKPLTSGFDAFKILPYDEV